MKQRILLPLVMILFITALQAQKKEQQKVTGYAITAMDKGGRSWKEVRLVDLSTGADLKTIYNSSNDVEVLNARTGKPVVKKDGLPAKTITTTGVQKKIVNLDAELADKKDKEVIYYKKDNNVVRLKTDVNGQVVYHYVYRDNISSDKPFSTNSAAMAYDKKHERLYYTPMGINQLRYIDLKSNKIYYFEDENFGKVNGPGDACNQITRMVMASDGNGYALTNDGNNLIRFTTGKNPEITELGAVSDEDPAAKVSVHSRNGYGGDMVADASGNLYLITANRNVFKISIESRSAKYLGAIKGLPSGFSTNGAMVEEGSKVLIASSESTVGYFRFDLNTLESEKVSNSGDVFNASDLANGTLAFEKKKKDRKNKDEEERPVAPVVAEEKTTKGGTPVETAQVDGILVYPNPASTSSIVKISFDSQPQGRYQVQLFDLAGKMISTQEVNVQNRLQVAELKLPTALSGGTYFVKIFNEANRINSISKLIVQ